MECILCEICAYETEVAGNSYSYIGNKYKKITNKKVPLIVFLILVASYYRNRTGMEEVAKTKDTGKWGEILIEEVDVSRI